MKIKPSSIEEIRQRTRSLIEDHEKSIRQFHENHFPHLFGREGKMVDWTPEAIEAAHCAMFQEPYDGTTAPMIGAGLDAAAAAQGIKDEENARLREELAAAQSRITDLTKISATLNVRTSKLNALREENARVRAALDKCGDAMDYTDDYFDGPVAVVQDAKDAIRAARAAIREGGREG